MAKNPNKNPAKGFIGELAQAPKQKPAKERFDYSSPVAGTTPVRNMNTTKRLDKLNGVSKADSSITAELAKHIKARRS